MQITCMEKEFVKTMKKTFGEYHDLHLKCDTLLLADVFKNFRKMCLKIYQLVPAKFVTNLHNKTEYVIHI